MKRKLRQPDSDPVIGVRLPQKTIDAVDAAARAQARTRGAQIRWMLQQQLEKAPTA